MSCLVLVMIPGLRLPHQRHRDDAVEPGPATRQSQAYFILSGYVLKLVVLRHFICLQNGLFNILAITPHITSSILARMISCIK